VPPVSIIFKHNANITEGFHDDLVAIMETTCDIGPADIEIASGTAAEIVA